MKPPDFSVNQERQSVENEVENGTGVKIVRSEDRFVMVIEQMGGGKTRKQATGKW